MWLVSALAAHVLTLVSTVVAVASHGFRGGAPDAVVILLAVAPLIALLWFERRRPSGNRPDSWPVRTLVAALPQALGFAMAASDLLAHTTFPPWQRIVLLASVPLLVQTGAAVTATRSVRRPLSAELGETDLEVRVELRSVRPGVPRWLCMEDVRLTGQEIIIIVQPGPTWRAMHRIALIDVIGVDARPATPHDNPWLTLDDGSGYRMVPGDVVVLRHRHGTQLLPAYDADAFADVIRARARKVRRAANDRAPRAARDR
jgi:hypothetical protein